VIYSIALQHGDLVSSHFSDAAPSIYRWA